MLFVNGAKYKVILNRASRIILKMKKNDDFYVFQPWYMQKQNTMLTYYQNECCTINLNLSDKLSVILLTLHINSVKTGDLINNSSATIIINEGYAIEAKSYFNIDYIDNKLYLGRIELELCDDNYRILREYLKENAPGKKIEL
ncbi:MAG: hypothetical protein A2015_01280 [Spirochaetes bacterium GWF1_31_7]|nr:MAG: hypothetical protein A2Y29_01475 [Spirochaetes bacterium GWE2_31_10]OHD52014.1 MAG: hypothetical protein A2015_01280 [Spirochaetes bacterium GWF1_31_7]OHD81062.1 MAG: hypothetical protein A2355_11330 [Spirochaetes bacterium RIFOXYB1_FULL_32_8]HBD94767.1 hypothetical protein [Spirochaetia bacterium]HBI39095.1 hypothetical protein [Spirochaetia bacterium]